MVGPAESIYRERVKKTSGFCTRTSGSRQDTCTSALTEIRHESKHHRRAWSERCSPHDPSETAHTYVAACCMQQANVEVDYPFGWIHSGVIRSRPALPSSCPVIVGESLLNYSRPIMPAAAARGRCADGPRSPCGSPCPPPAGSPPTPPSAWPGSPQCRGGCAAASARHWWSAE
jgi:hypothetical protein